MTQAGGSTEELGEDAHQLPFFPVHAAWPHQYAGRSPLNGPGSGVVAKAVALVKRDVALEMSSFMLKKRRENINLKHRLTSIETR